MRGYFKTPKKIILHKVFLNLCSLRDSWGRRLFYFEFKKFDLIAMEYADVEMAMVLMDWLVLTAYLVMYHVLD